MAVQTIKDIINDCTSKYADMTAFKFIDGKEIAERTYAQLKADSDSAARMLDSYNLCGKHIVLVGASSYEWVVCYIAAVSSGSVAVPLDAGLPPSELYDLINRSDASAIIYDKSQLAMIEGLADNCPNITHKFAMNDTAMTDGSISLKTEIEKNYGEFDVEVDPDKLCTLMFTSGTTGKSKGVMLSNRNLATNIESCYVSNEPGTVSMSVLPIHHAYCLTSGILKSLSLGGCICINDSMLRFARNFKKFKPDVTLLVPLIIETLYQQLRDADPNIPKSIIAENVFGGNLDIIFSGGAYLNPDLVDFFAEYGVRILQGYGMTECSPVISNNNQLYAKRGSIGKPIANCTVKFVDEEICVKSSSVMLGYYNMPEETKEAIDEDGWLHTGDLGCMDDEGFIYITGRKKNLIILSNGENISPEEIENEIGKADIVKEIIVREADNCIEAEIFPDVDYAELHAISDIKAELQAIVDAYNKDLPLYKRVASLKVRDIPFEKNATQKIKRF